MARIEVDSEPVGECWLQGMNLDRVAEAHPGADVRRIDLALAKAAWGRGIGSAAIALLVEFVFGTAGADFVYAMDIADYNPRSRRAFERAGFALATTHLHESGKARETYDFALSREKWLTSRASRSD